MGKARFEDYWMLCSWRGFILIVPFTLIYVPALVIWTDRVYQESVQIKSMQIQYNGYADNSKNWVPCHYDVLPETPALIRSVAWLDTRAALKDTPCLRLHILYPTKNVNNGSAIISSKAAITSLLYDKDTFEASVLDKFDFQPLKTVKQELRLMLNMQKL